MKIQALFHGNEKIQCSLTHVYHLSDYPIYGSPQAWKQELLSKVYREAIVVTGIGQTTYKKRLASLSFWKFWNPLYAVRVGKTSAEGTVWFVVRRKHAWGF